MNTAAIQDAILQLSQSSDVDQGKIEEVYHQVVASGARASNTERVSIWFFNPGRSTIVCEALYLCSSEAYSVPKTELKRSDYPAYFSFFDDAKILNADDAHVHPATREFSQNYLTPLGITSMLDVPIKRGKEMVGVVCFEHIGPKREWTKTEMVFASIMSELISKTILAAEREQKTRELIQASRLASLGEMSTMLAHEINNPLAVVKGFVDLSVKSLKKPTPDLALITDWLMKASGGINRAAKIVSNLKLFARIEDRSKQEVDVASVIENCAEMVRQTSANHGIQLRVGCPEKTSVYASPLEFSQVLINLLINAVDAIIDTGTSERWISIQVQSNAKELQILMANSGPKIPVSVSDRMFDPFFTTKPAGKGTGIGLKISRQIIQEHGGTLVYDGEAPFTTFLIRIPRHGHEHV